MRAASPRFGELSSGSTAPWLPPLASTPGSASARLARSLQAPAQPAPLSARSSRGISRPCARANERAAEAEHGFRDLDLEVRRVPEPSTSSREPTRRCSKTFDHLLESVNNALNRGESLGPIRMLKKDEAVTETVPAQGCRHYKITLPSKPTVITVAVTKISGVPPALWASTGAERPSARNHEIAGNDRLLYEHGFPSAEELEEGLDRQRAVPPFRELFVTAEAEAGESSFRVEVSFSAMKIALSRGEITQKVQKIRRGWEVKVAALQQEPTQREAFEDHVKNIEEERQRKRQTAHSSVDYVDRNARLASEATRQKALQRLQEQAVLGFAQQDAALAKRRLRDQEEEQKRLQWQRRAEERQLQKQQEEELVATRRRVQEMQRSWLTSMALFTFMGTFGHAFQKNKAFHEYMHRISKSVAKLQRFFLRALVRKRRLALYGNVVKLRIALTLYPRVLRPALMCRAQPVMKGFLDQYISAMETKSVSGLIARFRSKVVKIQRWWHKILTIRKAHVELFLPRWNDAQAKVYGEMSQASHQEDPAAKQASYVALQVTTLPNRRQSKAVEEALPNYVAKLAVKLYIGAMRRSHRQRLRDWEDNKKWAKDLEGFGVRLDDQAVAVTGRPRTVYFNRDELEGIVRQYVELWRKGGFKEIRFHRRRVFLRFFHCWQQAPGSSRGDGGAVALL